MNLTAAIYCSSVSQNVNNNRFMVHVLLLCSQVPWFTDSLDLKDLNVHKTRALTDVDLKSFTW